MRSVSETMRSVSEIMDQFQKLCDQFQKLSHQFQKLCDQFQKLCDQFQKLWTSFRNYGSVSEIKRSVSEIMQLAYMMRSTTIQTQTPPPLYTRTGDKCGCLCLCRLFVALECQHTTLTFWQQFKGDHELCDALYNQTLSK